MLEPPADIQLMDDKQTVEPSSAGRRMLRNGWAFYLWVVLAAVWLVSSGVAIVAGTAARSLEVATAAVLVSTVTFGLFLVWSVALFVMAARRASATLNRPDV